MIPRHYESRILKALETLSRALTKTQTFVFKNKKEADAILKKANKSSAKYSSLIEDNNLVILIDCTPYAGKNLNDTKEDNKPISRIQPRWK